MDRKVLFFAVALVGAGRVGLLGQASAEKAMRRAVYTVEQAQAGRAAFENSCARCHTLSAMGRKGEPGEMPPLESLAQPYRDFIGRGGGGVPPLVGPGFVKGWGKKTAGELFTLFRGAADTTPVAELSMSDETLLNITAYLLQRNGARAGSEALTKAADAVFESIVE